MDCGYKQEKENRNTKNTRQPIIEFITLSICNESLSFVNEAEYSHEIAFASYFKIFG